MIALERVVLYNQTQEDLVIFHGLKIHLFVPERK